jgi:hypothetical protein
MMRETAGGITLSVRAQPGARKTAITGVYGSGPAAQLKIAVQAPPVEGRANEALIVFLARFFALSRTDVLLVAGELSRSKVFLLRGVGRDQVETSLAKTIGSAARSETST